MENNSAKDSDFYMLEMEAMYKANRQAHEDHKALMSSKASEMEKHKAIIPTRYGSFEDFISQIMEDLAGDLHGDVVLYDAKGEHGVELKRVRGGKKTIKPKQ